MLAAVGVACLLGVLLIGYLPSRVDGGVEPAVRRVLAWLQGLGAPEWVNYDFADFVANIGFFVPIGLVAALLLPWRAWWAAIPLGAALSGLLELGQLLFLPERFASWTDVAANSAGAVIGALVGRRDPAAQDASGALARDRQLRRDQLGDLHGVERGALAQVVVRDEHRETAVARHALVLTDAADEARIGAGRVERGRDVHERDARGILQAARAPARA